MQHAVIIASDVDVRIPKRALEFSGFRRWLHSGAFPEEGLISFIESRVEVDISPEEFFEHGQIKTEVACVLTNLFKESKFGKFAPDGTRYSSLRARLSTEPDGMVVSNESLRSGRVRFDSGKAGKNTELIGTPDIVIEIVSPSSVEKDTDRLMRAYFKARIPEYWLIDVRDGEVRFDLYRWKADGYVASRKSDGWLKSPGLGKSFRLTAAPDDTGHPEYTLQVR
jgi:Uma2 family endonuclease